MSLSRRSQRPRLTALSPRSAPTSCEHYLTRLELGLFHRSANPAARAVRRPCAARRASSRLGNQTTRMTLPARTVQTRATRISTCAPLNRPRAFRVTTATTFSTPASINSSCRTRRDPTVSCQPRKNGPAPHGRETPCPCHPAAPAGVVQNDLSVVQREDSPGVAARRRRVDPAHDLHRSPATRPDEYPAGITPP